MNEETKNQSQPAFRAPNKNCKRCWGRGVVVRFLAKDEVTGEEVKETEACFCTSPNPKGRKQ